MTAGIVLLIWVVATILLVWAHFWICKKIVFIEIKKPTRSDLIECQYDHGGPMMMLPVINIVFFIFTILHYLGMSDRIKATDWGNKPLKR